jgi:hypothetical protein
MLNLNKIIKNKNKKISKFNCIKVSVLIILMLVPQPAILEMVSQKWFCHCLIKRKKTKKIETQQSFPSSDAIQLQ